MSTEKPISTNAVETEEDYEFCAIPNSGKINVANHSYGPEETKHHIHTVTVSQGVAISCSCPGHTYNATTKHREAVEDHEAVIATADPSLCSNEHEWCPGPAAIDVESGPEVGDKYGCFRCWMDAWRAEEDYQ